MFLRAERAGELDEVEDQLFRFGRILDASPELSVILDDPITTGAARASLVGRLLDGRAHQLTTDLLGQLALDPGARSFSHGVQEIVVQAAERKDKIVATVEAATSLTIEQIVATDHCADAHLRPTGVGPRAAAARAGRRNQGQGRRRSDRRKRGRPTRRSASQNGELTTPRRAVESADQTIGRHQVTSS